MEPDRGGASNHAPDDPSDRGARSSRSEERSSGAEDDSTSERPPQHSGRNAAAGGGVGTNVSTAVAAPVVDTVSQVIDAPDPGRPEPSVIYEGETGDQIFNRLVMPEVDVMWRVALSLTRNRADAEDLVQESLLRAYKAIESFDGRYPRAWLLTILRNTERNRHRRRRPELLNDPDSIEDRGPRTESDEVEQHAEGTDFDEAVSSALENLPENFRRVAELVDVDGLTYQEAAEVLDVPLGTIMSRLHRARRRIREQLIPAGYGPNHLVDAHQAEQARLAEEADDVDDARTAGRSRGSRRSGERSGESVSGAPVSGETASETGEGR